MAPDTYEENVLHLCYLGLYQQKLFFRLEIALLGNNYTFTQIFTHSRTTHGHLFLSMQSSEGQ